MKTAPVYMPEFDRAFSWAMCRNVLCDNFGIPFERPVNESGEPLTHHNERYRLDKDDTLRCKFCKQSFELKSNAAVRPIARLFLSLSLPFADCPDDTCENHGYNVYEHYFPPKSPYRSKKRYRRGDGEHNATCVKCRRKFAIGEPLRIGVELNERDIKKVDEKISEAAEAELKKKELDREEPEKEEPEKEELDREEELMKIDLRKQETVKTLPVIVAGILEQRMVSRTLRPRLGLEHPISTSAYYARLKQLGARLRDYHSWRNAHLLYPRNGISVGAPVRVYTDTLIASLKRHGKEHRYQPLNIIVSVLALEDTAFILAAHPCFYPKDDTVPSLESLIDSVQDEGLAGLYDDWDCLNHPGKIKWATEDDEDEESDGGLPDISRNGYFITSPYAEAAHFLVVDKMLRRFRKVHYYMDAARDLYPAALCALAGSVRSGRVEIALFQHEKWERKEGDVAREVKYYSDKEKEALLDAAFRSVEKQFDSKASPKKGELPLTTKQDKRVRASLYKGAVKGGRSKKGGWAWLHYPPDSDNYRNCRTLWLTRSPEKTFEEHGKPLLYYATLQLVDSIMNSMRSRVRALFRPEERSKAGRSYQRSYFRVDTLSSEMWIYLLSQNYRKISKKSDPIPAHKLGLMTDAEGERLNKKWRSSAIEADFAEIALDFRLGFKEAGKMSEWLR